MSINLLNYRRKIYSSIGNDGIIDFIFGQLYVEEGIFVEFGAWDGIKNSNCRNLINKGWKGIFIEGDENRYRDLKNNYKDYKDKISCVNNMIDSENNLFDNIVGPYSNGRDIDFCSIDIDGLDLEVFETFEKYLPKVICIEGGQMLHPYHKRIKNRLAKQNIQQSLKVIVDSFKKKGYKILCSYQDSFFIREEFYHLFPVTEDILTLYFDGLRSLPGRIPFIQKYNGKVGLKNKIVDYILKKTNYKKYGWGKRKIWAKEKKSIIYNVINDKEKKEREKYEKS